MDGEGRGKRVLGEIPPARRSSSDEAVNARPTAGKVYHVIVAVNSHMVAEKKRLRSCSVATVVDATQGVPNAKSIASAMAIRFDPEWQWNVQPFDDGVFIIQFPSPELARDAEKLGTLRFPGFSLSLIPWSDDLIPHEKLDIERECRWVVIKRLPFFLLHRDTVLRMLKPLGYLNTLYRGAYMDELRAHVRVRRGRRLPCTIRCIIDRWQCIVTVDMESGQQPLPWDTVDSPGKGSELLVWRYTAVENGGGPDTLDGIDFTTWTNVTDALVAMESTYDDDDDDDDDMDASHTIENMGATSHDDMDAMYWSSSPDTSESYWSSPDNTDP